MTSTTRSTRVLTTRAARTTRRDGGPVLTVVWWHSIPAMVSARDTGRTVRSPLPPRFQTAIDRAATGGGRAGSDSYHEGWTTSRHRCTADLDGEVEAAAADLDRRFPPEVLEALVHDLRRRDVPAVQELVGRQAS